MNENRIMIVDDEVDILNLLEKALNIEGYYNITKIDNGLDAVSICKQIQPDVIILDIMLPGIDGYEVCKRIRQFSHCPILFLSSKNDELDKILGLAVGGDDYVTKPFSPKEVAYRVKAQLRRAEYKQEPVQNHTITIGELVIDPEGCRVTKNEKKWSLPQENLKFCIIWHKILDGLSVGSVYMKQFGGRTALAAIILSWCISGICVKSWRITLLSHNILSR